MSTGNFIYANYASALTGEVHPIRIQPETATLVINGQTNTIPAGPVTSQLQAQVTGRRGIGLFAAKVGVRVTASGTSDFAVGSVHYLPWLDASTLFSVISPKFQEGTYQGAAVRVIGYSPERF